MEPVDKEMKLWTDTAAMSHVFIHTESVMDIVSVSVYMYINHIAENAFCDIKCIYFRDTSVT